LDCGGCPSPKTCTVGDGVKNILPKMMLPSAFG
jgi:hypothetical protein